jgi:hypothetical protein
VSPPIHPLTCSQGAVFLINSRQRYFSCAPPCGGEALFRSYGRFFAEFLGDLSLVRLGLLDLTTCVGLRYGFYAYNLRRFSWKLAQQNLLVLLLTFPLSLDLLLKAAPGFSWASSFKHGHKSNNMLCLLNSVSPSIYIKVREY